MSIEYRYEIIAVDEAARCMEVVYSAEGHPTQHIGARMPYEGESLEAVVHMYAPISYWEELKQKVVCPVVGTTGTVTPPSSVPISSVLGKEPTVVGAQIL